MTALSFENTTVVPYAKSTFNVRLNESVLLITSKTSIWDTAISHLPTTAKAN
jgi:hypothetical protein